MVGPVACTATGSETSPTYTHYPLSTTGTPTLSPTVSCPSPTGYTGSVPFLTPTAPAAPYYTFVETDSSPYMDVYTVMGDPTPFILGATTTQPTACNSQCINVVLRYDPVDPGTLPGVTTSSLTSSTYTCALHVTPTGPPGNSQYYIIVKGDFKLDSYTSVSYEKKIFRNIVAVPIITINTTPMTAEFYYIDDPA